MLTSAIAPLLRNPACICLSCMDHILCSSHASVGVDVSRFVYKVACFNDCFVSVGFVCRTIVSGSDTGIQCKQYCGSNYSNLPCFVFSGAACLLLKAL